MDKRQNVNIQYVNIRMPKPGANRPKHQGLENYLEFQFPVRKQLVNWVKQHSDGFKSKKNVDLFQHYYRMYLKNRFKKGLTKKQK